MTEQLHRRFSTEEVKVLLEKYLDDKVKLTYIVEILNITRRRFFQLLRDYKEDPDSFSIQYRRRRATSEVGYAHRRLFSRQSLQNSQRFSQSPQRIGRSFFGRQLIPLFYYSESYSTGQYSDPEILVKESAFCHV